MQVEDFSYDIISSVQYETGFMFGKITIYSVGSKAQISEISKDYVQDFAEFVRLRTFNSEQNTRMQSLNSSDDMINKLEKISNLRKDGVLTNEEFENLKKKITMENSQIQSENDRSFPDRNHWNEHNTSSTHLTPIKSRFWQKKWFAWVLLFTIAPIGIFLLWKYHHH